MNRLLAALVAAAVVSSSVPSFALEVREPRAHLIVDVPDSWKTDVDGRWVRAAPQDGTFHFRLVGIDRGWAQEKEAEDFMLTQLAEHMNDSTVDTHGRRIEDWHGFEGVEIFGHGRRKDGQPAKFFAVVLRDKANKKKGVVALGIGTPESWERHHKGVYESLHSLRTY
jgi:hypothetical protein